MKVIEHIEKAKNPLFSYEIVPPPRGRSAQDIIEIVEQLVPFDPPWIDVTSHSAGAFYNENNDGSVERRIYKKRPGTIGICGIIQNRFKIDTVTHLLSLGFTQEETEDALIELNYLGIHNILALRGDAPNYKKTYSKDRSVNHYAIDLVKQVAEIKQGRFIDEISNARPLDFCAGVAGYPEKHFEAPNMKQDIFYLKQKLDAGADYVTCQMFYDNQKYFEFVKACRAEGITAPIIPGIKIIKSIKQLSSIPKNFHVDFPDELVDEIHNGPEHVKEIGVKWAMKQTQELLEFGVPGVHFYIMNDTSSVLDIVKKFK
jgi:methylenetetrahydrofolate reductase (NADPH)